MSKYLIILIVSSIALIGAFGIEHFFNVAPCHLCWIERYIYMVMIVFSLLGLKFKKEVAINYMLFIVVIGLNFVSLFHVGVEHGLWDSSCSFSILGQSDTLPDKPFASCEDVNFTFLGLSLATYNMIVSFMVLILSVLNLEKRKE